MFGPRLPLADKRSQMSRFGGLKIPRANGALKSPLTTLSPPSHNRQLRGRLWVRRPLLDCTTGDRSRIRVDARRRRLSEIDLCTDAGDACGEDRRGLAEDREA